MNKQLLITEWNNTQQDYPKNKNLVELIENQVIKSPQKVAFYCQEQQISYKTLNKLANKLAHFIRQNVSGSGKYIAIYMDRSIETIICLLAIMKSNNTYVPIDVDTPLKQFKQIIKNCHAAAILTTKTLPDELRSVIEQNHTQIINLTEQETLNKMSEKNPRISEPNHPAYLLYTSGTTGNPKGVQITHAGLINLLLAMQKEVNFTYNDVLLAITPITFDISGAEIYLPLITGGSFVFASNATRYNPYDIINSIAKYHITIMQATPATWQMLINAEWKNEYNIKILCGGEGLNTWLATKLFATQSSIWNFYGPTETTIWSTCYKIDTIDKSNSLISIGKPLANTQIYILDEQMQPQPVGIPGELYIGGDGVALGYLNNQELNHKCFLPNPFSKTIQSKIYKTGDMALRSADGELHYIGRVDTQIKIRGHRIEAEAIENILMEYDHIKECVVLDKTPDNKHELVAYITLRNDEISLTSLKDYLKNHLPNYMIPTKFVVIDNFPLTSNGKINRKTIPTLTCFRYLSDGIKNSTLMLNKYEEIIADLIQNFLQRTDVDPESNFFDLGINSILLIDLATTLTRTLNQEISAVSLFEHPTIRTFASFIMNSQHTNLANQQLNTLHESLKTKSHSKEPFENNIAVIGMACKLPGADDPETFWKSIIDKTESISFFNEAELMTSGIPHELINNPDYVPARGVLSDIDKFDAAFFGYSPSEASMMDPQHRVFLEQSWAALENSGYVSDYFSGKIGLFAGMSDSSYLLQQLLKNQQIQTDYDSQQIMLATSSHYLCTKVAYAMGLKGPCVTVNTACSTGLVSIAMACESIVNNRCDMALAGAITIVTPQQSGYLYQELGILSPNGHCSVFDEEAKGTVFSNGCVVVVLKRLSDALRDNDNILAVIKGWSVNNDGANKAGFTAPSVNGQAACIHEAIVHAGIVPTEVEYLEAHGTGTLLGDPIEIAALTKGYDYETYKQSQYCAIGSVKANIGHTDTAAGAAGFIKAVLALREKTLPPNINYTKENKKINFSHTPYYVNEKAQPWNTKYKRRHAAVHSLGLGGTNAHVILQQAPTIKTTTSKHGNVLILSAKTAASLTTTTSKLYKHISHIPQNNHTEKILADISYTLQVGRKPFKWRTAIAYTGYEHLLKALSTPKQTLIEAKPIQETRNKQIIFGFVGQGAQYASMARDIYKEHPLFRTIVDDCCEQLKQYMDLDLRELLFPKELSTSDANKTLRETQYAQPALFVIEYALSQLLITLGIKPTGMIGHSVGEYVAATVSGVLDINDALKLIAARANLMAKTEPGVMLAVPLSKKKLSKFITQHVELAVHNAPNLCIVAGSQAHITRFEATLQPLLEPEHLVCQYLHTSHAFHSRQMDAILDDFLDYTSSIALKNPNIPYISNVTGKWINQSDLQNKRYWAEHIRSTVLFSEGIQQLNMSDNDIFIEVGPGQTLLQLVRQHCNKPGAFLHTLPHYQNAQDHSYGCFLNTISKLWLLDINIIWNNLYTNEIRQRVALPTYSFERQSHWIYPSELTEKEKLNVFTKNMLYSPTWERERKLSVIPQIDVTKNKCWLIFSNDGINTTAFIKKLQSNQELVYVVSSSLYFKKSDKFNFTIDPEHKEHYIKLLQRINVPYENCIVVHTWLEHEQNIDLDNEQLLQKGPFCLLYLSQAYNEIYPNKNLHVLVLTNNIYSVIGNEHLIPTKAAILGPCKVIPQEHDNITFKLIDFEANSSQKATLVNNIYWEANTISQACFKTEIAYRGEYRWQMKLQPCLNHIEENQIKRLKSEGIYLITGGLGGVGLVLAQYLAKNYHAHIILITRATFLPENEWSDYINNKNKDQKTINQINTLKNIKKHAASLTIEIAAVESDDEMRKAIQSIRKKFGHIDGVVHAAGQAGGGAAHLKTIEEYQKVLKPKLDGTINLIDLLKDEPLDFLVFISSITSITGFPGQIDYCSANRVLDAYASSASKFTHPVFCVTMNWQAWRDVGMAAESNTILIRLDENNSTTPHDGCLLFEKIVNSNLNQIIISNENLNLYTIHKISLDLTPSTVATTSDTQSYNHSDVTKILQNIWCNTLGITEVNIDADFYELGGHSLLAISLLAKIRKTFNLQIPSTLLFKVRTIRALSTVIQSHTDNNNDCSSLVMLQQGESSISPLFMIHPVGGTVFCYLSLVKNLNTDRTIYGFQDPSIELEKPLFSTIEELAVFYRKLIQKIQPTGPYYLCGASFGASVVTEIAFQLLEINESINFVGLIDGWGALSKTQFDVDYVKNIIHLNKQSTKSPDLTKNMENQEIWEKMLQHRLNMMINYTHKKVPAKLVLFKATDLLLEYKDIDKEDNHWTNYSNLPIDIFHVPGDHNTMLQNPNVADLAKYIQKYLDK
ncbi:MAG: amino acid adenylation domain-containing protein [Legionellaceae bacterium]|nr:amino acid adenylation domain-containing protein [Legionellaceae bacterium]